MLEKKAIVGMKPRIILLRDRMCNNNNIQFSNCAANGKRPFSCLITCNGSKKIKRDAYDNDHDNILNALPQELFEFIIQKLDFVGYHCVSAVCKPLRSVAIAAKQNPGFSLMPQLPWMLLSPYKRDFAYCDFAHYDFAQHFFFSLSHGKSFKLKLPEILGFRCRCYGSSFGWLIMFNGVGDDFLLHPFSRLWIQLPSRSTLPLRIFNSHYAFDSPEVMKKFKGLWQGPIYIKKAAILSPPVVTSITSTTGDIDVVNSTSDNCIVVAIYADRHLCFCRPRDQAWTDLSRCIAGTFEDIIYYNGQLYAVNTECDLVLIELGLHPRGTWLHLRCPPFFVDSQSYRSIYLVESRGELLMVKRHWLWPEYNHRTHLNIGPGATFAFTVFKLDFTGHRWKRVRSLGDQMLFLGTSGGISLSASHFPGFKGNCIYFTDENFTLSDDTFSTYCDVGVFSMEDQSIKSFFPTGSRSPAPIWFIPTHL